MKIFCTFFLLFTYAHTNAQDVLVPYRLGDKFGLSDLRGNLKVEAIYDGIWWIGEDYFQYRKIKHYKKVIDAYGQKKEIDAIEEDNGVIKAGKVIISKQRFRNFWIHHRQFIAGSENSMRPENCMLYKKDGTPLFEKEINGSIQVKYFSEMKMLEAIDPRYILFTISERIPRLSHERLWRFGSYDTVSKSITWFFRNAQEFGILKLGNGKDSVGMVFLDSNNKSNEKIFRYNFDERKYELVKAGKSFIPKENPRTANRERDYSSDVYTYDVPPVISADFGDSEKPLRKVLRVWRDSLTYGNKRIEIPGAIFHPAKHMMEQPPVIYSVNGKFGVVSDDKKWTAAKYDSLYYVLDWRGLDSTDYYYLAAMRNNGSLKYGIIDANGKVHVPIQFDSLQFVMPALDFNYVHSMDSISFFLTLPKDPYRFPQTSEYPISYRNHVIAYRAGKSGLLNIEGKEILPVAYDTICRNGQKLGYSYHFEVEHDFYLVKSADRWGIVDKKLKSPPVVFEAEGFVPVCIYTDYYGVKGLNLISLANGKGLFCYANENGMVYYTKE